MEEMETKVEPRHVPGGETGVDEVTDVPVTRDPSESAPIVLEASVLKYLC